MIVEKKQENTPNPARGDTIIRFPVGIFKNRASRGHIPNHKMNFFYKFPLTLGQVLSYFGVSVGKSGEFKNME